jgi:hypothetical protein
MDHGAPITMAQATVMRIAGSQHSNNAWPTCAELAGPADPVRTCN